MPFPQHGKPAPLTPEAFYKYFYDHARRLRLEKLLLLCLELYTIEVPTGFFKPLLDPGGGFMFQN
jgi:hypothetical protein